MAFRLESSAADTLVLAGDLELPDGWQMVAPGRRTSVPPGEATVALLSAVTADRAWPRCISLRYRVRQRSRPQEPRKWIASASRPVCVEEKSRIEARLMDVPKQVVAGDDYEVRLRVVNTGNVSVRARIEPNAHGLEVRSGRDSILVASGASTTIPLVVETPRRGREWEHVLQVRLVPGSASTSVTSVTGRVPVVPRQAEQAGSRGNSLRTSVTARTGRGGGDVAPFEVKGSGPVPVGEAGTLTFLARGPATRWSSRGLGDEYRARLQTRRMDVRLGDGLYRLSRLTEPGRYAFGGSVERSVGAWTFGALFDGSRGNRNLSSEWGGFAGVEAGDHASFRLNYLEREGGGRGGEPDGREEADDGARLASAETTVELGSALRFAGEAGYSRRGGEASTAYTTTLSGRLPFFSYRLSRIEGEAAYPNAYGGVTQNLARFGIDLGSFVRVEGFYSDHRLRRTQRSGNSRSRSRKRTRQVGAGLSLGSLVSLRARQRRRRGRLLGGRYRLRSRSVEAHTAISLGGLRVEANGELGRIHGLEAAGARDYQSVELSTDMASRSGGHLSLGVEGYDGYRLYRRRRERSVRVLMDAALPIRSDLEVGLFGEARWIVNRELAPTGHVRARLSYDLPFGHELSLRSRIPIGESFGTDELEVVGEYTVPFRVPLGDGATSTQLRGKVVNVTSEQGVEGLAVRVGERRAVTGEDGGFTVTGLSPGRHYLRPDLSTLDAGLAPVDAMPRVVQVEQDTDARVRIGVARPGTISGRVRIQRRRSISGQTAPSDTAAEGLEDVLVVLDGAAGTYRATTGEGGQFSFSRMPPGSWTVSIEAGRLPPHHGFERTSADVKLAPGDEAEVNFLASPETQRIRVIDEGEVKTSGSGTR